MAVNSIHVSTTPEQVYDLLSDPYSYADWVVGTSEITWADDSWPAPGSRFGWRAGAPPLLTSGETQVIEAERFRRLVLRIPLPVGYVEIEIELHRRSDGTVVTLRENLSIPLARRFSDVPLHVRNARAVSQLKALAEGRADQETRVEALPALLPAPHWLDLPDYAELTARVERCYLAVATKHGPHITPTAFTSSFGRVWIFAARNSVKVRMLSRDPRAGVLIRQGDRSVVAWGEATVLDPRDLWKPEHLVERAYALPAIARYAVTNRSRLGGYVGDALGSFFELDPLARVLVSIAPKRLLLVENDRIVDKRGPSIEPLRPTTVLTDQTGEDLDLDELPESIADIAEGKRVAAALGWQSSCGPAALPAHWHEDRGLVSLPASLLDGVTEGPLALSMDDDEGSGLDDQKGLMVRGSGRVVGRRGGYAAIEVEQERTTVWEGADTATVTA